ncbi:MAG: hydantoinase/oxoprolinase family protein, partial [Clostridia bacterium]|nr:hydantoinase/oxoprolinase family protein [Clostridia bacterium]
LKVKQMVHEQLDIPVVCAHELTSSLGFHHRTVTAALNAKLIPIISELVNATKDVLRKNNIEVPIMMVKGDGSLMQESSAIDKPIETILSGPSASIKGGIFLTNQEEALILDMGGTTTDIAHVESGRVKIKEKGASVGGWLTRVKAAEISTFGIGGDSYLHFNTDGKLKIGPQRVQPLCVAGKNDPKLINELKTIRKDEKYELFSDQEIDCFSINKKPKKGELNKLDEKILQLLEDGPHSLFYLARSLEKDAEALELSRLVSENILTRISMTPTDILHALGKFKLWDEKISLVAVEILADRMGKTISELLEMAVSQITNQLTIACLQSITNFEEQSFNLKNNDAAMYLINKAGNLGTQGLLMTQFIVSKPIVAIGAPVNAWMPQVCKMLNTKLMIPEHAEVANAIGAAVGQIMETVDVLIRPDRKHKKYILHAPWGRDVFDTLNDAMDYAVPAIKKYVADLMMHAGSEQFDIVESHEDIFVDIIGPNKKTYVETRIKATGIGSPMWIQNK